VQLAGKLSDRELRLRALKLRNAYDQPGLIQRPLADADKLADVINIYEHEHWPNEKVYCSQCQGHHHRKGFTALVVTATGQLIRMLLGSTCGAEAFGEKWHIAERRIQKQHDRQWELARLDRLDTISTEMKSSLEDWRNKVPAVVGRKSAFVMKLPELASSLNEAYSQQHGHFYVHRIVKLRDGSQHRDTELLGPLPGSELFNPLNMIHAIDGTLQALKMMTQLISLSDTVSTKEMRKRRREFEEGLERLYVVAVMYAAAQDFFTADTFAKIVEWTRRYAVTERRYGWNGKSLENNNGWEDFDLPDPFPDLGDKPLDLIEEYRRAD